MTNPRISDDTARMLAAAGIVITPEGRERARRKLAEAEARMTPEKRAERRARVRRYSQGS